VKTDKMMKWWEVGRHIGSNSFSSIDVVGRKEPTRASKIRIIPGNRTSIEVGDKFIRTRALLSGL
jgi:hypothetical protein